jgi:uncharacterized membrane protein YedE/YeeE
MKQIREIFAALLCGAIFGFGLALSGMLDPARVRGFLDIFGRFDPSLAFVLAGAVAVSAAGYIVSRKLRTPILGGEFHIPERKAIDAPLVLGSAIFGVGWGMGGFCPGPGVAALSLGLAAPFGFTAAMLAGILLHDHGWRKPGGKAAPLPPRAALAPEEVDA